MKVLFIVPYSSEGPSNRYRVEQYLPYLKEKGVDCTLRPFISSDFFKIVYKKGHLIKKASYFLSGSIKRWLDIIKAAQYDLIFIHIESFPFGPAILETIYSRLKKPIIYDFEDAIYMPNFRDGRRFINRLRCPGKFYKIVNLSNHVIVCNKYMRDFVSGYNNNTTILPTSIDTEKFTLKNFASTGRRPVIGWIGSRTTSPFLKPLAKILASLAHKYEFSLKIIGGGEDLTVPGIDVINESWSLEKDVENFQNLDIGIYPLPDDECSKAKTPFKTIQYMSVGVVPVVSKVGGNREIVRDGINGFLASNEGDWYKKLSMLIENHELRKNIGIEGRKTVEERYSIKTNGPKLLNILEKVYNEKKKLC